jgi:hypothetical protein
MKGDLMGRIANFSVQCRLQNGNRTIVTYLPESLAAKGKQFQIQDQSGEWSRGWIIFDVGERKPSEFIPNDKKLSMSKFRVL